MAASAEFAAILRDASLRSAPQDEGWYLLRVPQDDDGEKVRSRMSRRIATPGTYRSRWAPYVRTHGSGQGQLPSGS